MYFRRNQLTATTAILAGLFALSAQGAAAQSRCGASYEIERGDTLYSISQACRVSLSRIMDLNPTLNNPRDIAVGTELRLVSSADSGERTPAGSGQQRYQVEQGDTLNTIARRLGVSVFELIAENGEFDADDLDIGQVLGVPDDRPSARVTISPSAGTEDSRVTLSASNLRPNDYVTIGAGPRAAEWTALTQAQADNDGRLNVEVSLPETADPGESFIFVVDTDRGVTYKSDPFDVTRQSPQRLTLEGRVETGLECPELVTPDGDRYALAGNNPPITTGEYVEISGVRAPAYCAADLTTVDVYDLREVAPPTGDDAAGFQAEGWVRAGTECPLLVTPSGAHYALTGDGVDGAKGEYVEIRGDRADISYCMEGRATITVDQIREVTAPRNGAGDQSLTHAYLVGGWTVKGGDCSRPDFDITESGTGWLRVETGLNGAPRTGYVELGSAPAFIFDQPYRALDLDRRGVDGLAVMPPAGGAIQLGGRTVEGDGRVFINCG